MTASDACYAVLLERVHKHSADLKHFRNVLSIQLKHRHPISKTGQRQACGTTHRYSPRTPAMRPRTTSSTGSPKHPRAPRQRHLLQASFVTHTRAWYRVFTPFSRYLSENDLGTSAHACRSEAQAAVPAVPAVAAAAMVPTPTQALRAKCPG